MTIGEGALLFCSGAFASGVNAVAGGGSLVSFPVLTLGLHIPERIANATNSIGLFPGSLSGGIGFSNQLKKTGEHFRTLVGPTILGSICGAWLLLNTSDQSFKIAVPFLILLASVLLVLQPKIKALLAKNDHHTVPVWVGMVLQFFVATYGGYFGAGMGIMMLAAFSLYMDGTIHEINAVKNWLGAVINIACSVVFLSKGLVLVPIAIPLALGAVVGGFASSVISQKIDSNKLRLAIAIYGFGMTAYYTWRTWT